jgi:spore coat protein H
MNPRRILLNIIVPLSIFVMTATTFLACTDKDVLVDPEITIEEELYDDTTFDTSDWTDISHGKSGPNDYDKLFNINEVQRIDLVITENRWNSMLADITSKYGTFGGTGGGPGAGQVGQEEVHQD